MTHLSPDQQQKIGEFVAAYGKIITHHANFLDAVESLGEQRELLGQDRNAPAGAFEIQAGNLRDLLGLLKTASKQGEIATETALQRVELQEKFARANGTLRMIIDEHADMNKKMARGSNPEKLAARYRKKHLIAEDETLEPKIERRIARRAKENRAEHKHLSAEIVTLSILREDLEGISQLLRLSAPSRGRADN